MAHWKLKRTLLIVGEGRDEKAFLMHIKQIFAPRGCNLKVSIKQAGGKGAQHVVDWTWRQAQNAAYDNVAVLLDTDTDWTDAVKKEARQRKIIVLTSDPRLEAMLLRIIGQVPNGDARAMKKQFSTYVSGDATRHENYAKHFDKDRLLGAAASEQTIALMLKLFNI